MINCLSTTFHRNGVDLTVYFTREDGFWGAELWISGHYEGLISKGRSTDLDTVVAEAGRYMDTHHPYTEVV